MKILANDGIDDDGKRKLEEAGHTVVTESVAQDDLIEAINKEKYEVVLVRSATKIRKDLIDACPSIRMIGRGGVGMDNIDVEYAKEKGIDVFNTPAASSQSVAELVIGQLFTLARNLHDANRQMPERGASDFKTFKKAYGGAPELRGKTLGIVGFGRIGRSVAAYALGIGMEVVAHDPFVESAEIELEVAGQKLSVPAKLTKLEDLLQQSDFVTVHVPKIDGKALIGEKELGLMKNDSYIVNASRGGVVDEDALIAALESGKLSGAALDVYENEPTPREYLLKHPKISLTPHIGAATKEAQSRIGIELADYIITNSN